MNKRNEHTPAAPRAALLLPAALALCLAAVACDNRGSDVVGDSANATNPSAAGETAPSQVDADRPLADQSMTDPCAGLTGPELDECLMQEDSPEVMGEVPETGQPMDDQLGADDPMDPAEVPPPPVTEEPMDNDPGANPDEVPPPA